MASVLRLPENLSMGRPRPSGGTGARGGNAGSLAASRMMPLLVQPGVQPGPIETQDEWQVLGQGEGEGQGHGQGHEQGQGQGQRQAHGRGQEQGQGQGPSHDDSESQGENQGDEDPAVARRRGHRRDASRDGQGHGLGEPHQQGDDHRASPSSGRQFDDVSLLPTLRRNPSGGDASAHGLGASRPHPRPDAGRSQLPRRETQRTSSTRAYQAPVSPIQANPRIAAILRSGLERPQSREADIRRPRPGAHAVRRAAGKPMLLEGLHGMVDISDRAGKTAAAVTMDRMNGTATGSAGATVGGVWKGALTSLTERRPHRLPRSSKKESKRKDSKKDVKKDKSDKKERKRAKKLSKKVKKLRQKHSAARIQRCFRERWARGRQLRGSGDDMSSSSAARQQCALLIQRVFRGHLARESAAVIQEAKDAGVMVAINGTMQGESGWYQDFDQQVYFFAVDEDDTWWEVVEEKTWKTYRDVRSEELLNVPLLVAKRGTKVGASGKYASVNFEEFLESKKVRLHYERWVNEDGTFIKVDH